MSVLNNIFYIIISNYCVILKHGMPQIDTCHAFPLGMDWYGEERYVASNHRDASKMKVHSVGFRYLLFAGNY